MRNLFDQYDGPENRLTHALAVCLDFDRALLRRFLAWINVEAPCDPKRLSIVEQSLPGEPLVTEEEAERRGLPDIIIHDGDEWCVLVESKIEARLTADQLARHHRTLRRRGFEQITCVALTKVDIYQQREVVCRTWAGMYELLGAVEEHEWASRLREYLRVAEVNLARTQYLTEGTLTTFDGFKFSAKNPYTYGEAKRLLKLAMRALRKDRSLRALGIDANANGRGAITGRSASNIWDFIPLKDRPAGNFTRYPHLTLAVHVTHLEVAITIPNGVLPAVRRRLIAEEVDGLVRLNGEILKRARKLVSAGASVEAYALQRHYPSQRSAGVVDARTTFALQTSQPNGNGVVTHQPEWATHFAALLGSKRANIQFGYVVKWSWDAEGVGSREALKLIVSSWHALEPLLAVLRGGPTGRARSRGRRQGAAR